MVAKKTKQGRFLEVMQGNERREQLLKLLENANGPLSAAKLAATFGITRQVVVADIALLRASGCSIRAEHLGYVLEKETNSRFKRITCSHAKDDIIKEYYAIVDNGGKVLKVIIAHDIYGELSADVSIESRYDAQVAVEKINASKSEPLSNLTGGVHSHLICVRDDDCYRRILDSLRELNMLIEAED